MRSKKLITSLAVAANVGIHHGIDAGFLSGHDSLTNMVNHYRKISRRSAEDLTCGRPVYEYNTNTFEDLALRSVTLNLDEDKPDDFEDVPDTDPEYRIVNGQEAIKHSWPWQVRAKPCSRWRCTYLCGGSLLSRYWSITAAHCLPYQADRGNITVGAHVVMDKNNEYDSALYGTDYGIREIIGHEDWNRYKRINDLALIKTRLPVVFGDKVQPICISSPTTCFNPGTACVVSGWGYTTERGPISKTLQEVAVKVIDMEMCKSAGMYNTLVTPEKQICAGYIDGEKDSCAGDSGGPLVCSMGKDQPWVLYGVVSWGWGCARAKKPGVYVNVPAFNDWIQDNIRDTASDAQYADDSFECAKCQDHADPNACPAVPGQYSEPITTTTQSTTTAEPTTTTPVVITETDAPLTTTTTEQPSTIDATSWTENCDHSVIDSQSGYLTSRGYENGAWYQRNKRCDIQLFNNPDNENKHMIITVMDVRLDNRKWCVRSGDKLTVQCDKHYFNFCDRMNAKTSYGQLYCYKIAKVMFSSNNQHQNKGFKLAYQITNREPTNLINKCKLPTELSANSNFAETPHITYGIVNVFRGLMYGARNDKCSWTIKVDEGKYAVVFFSTTKNYIPGRERYNRKQKEWQLQCQDRVIVSNGDGSNAITRCGRRSFTKFPKFVSNSNVAQLHLELDNSSHKRERFFFWSGSYDPETGEYKSL